MALGDQRMNQLRSKRGGRTMIDRPAENAIAGAKGEGALQ